VHHHLIPTEVAGERKPLDLEDRHLPATGASELHEAAPEMVRSMFAEASRCHAAEAMRAAGDAYGRLKAVVVTDSNDRPRTDRPAYCAYTKGP
jgi:hypothetical protein